MAKDFFEDLYDNEYKEEGWGKDFFTHLFVEYDDRIHRQVEYD